MQALEKLIIRSSLRLSDMLVAHEKNKQIFVTFYAGKVVQ